MDKNTTNNYFKTIQVVYTALIIGILVLSAVLYYISNNLRYELELSNPFALVVVIVAASGIFLSPILYRSILNGIQSSANLKSKLNKYMTATIVKGALLEGPALLASIVAYITQNGLFFIVTALMLLVMYLKFPSKVKFLSEVQLSMDEKSQLNQF